jgi:hypothetical protein
MVELKTLSFRAPTAGFTDKRALSSIPLPDRAPDVRRDITRVRAGTSAATWLAGRGEFLSFDFPDARVQSVFEDLSQFSGRHLETQQILEISQLLVTAAAHAEVHFVALGRQGFHSGTDVRFNRPRGL